MRKIVLLSVSVMLAGTALATSATARSAKSPNPVIDWSGFYAGGHLGYGQGRTAAGQGLTIDTTSKGFLGGGQLGYNFQSGEWVLGVEADVSAANIDGSTNRLVGTDVYSSQPSIRWTSLLTARFGHAFGHFLPYVKGGVAFTGLRYYLLDITNGVSAEKNFSRTGWTVGGGLEYAIDGPWSVRAEYDYLDFRQKDLPMTDSTGASVVLQYEQHLHQVKFSLNYRFGG